LLPVRALLFPFEETLPMAASSASSVTPEASGPSLRERIEAWCRRNGYRPGHYGDCQHDCGLPRLECAWVQPEWSPIDGDHVILVGAETVIQAVCPYPWGHNDWRVRATCSYANTDELKRLLDRLVKRPQGCW